MFSACSVSSNLFVVVVSACVLSVLKCLGELSVIGEIVSVCRVCVPCGMGEMERCIELLCVLSFNLFIVCDLLDLLGVSCLCFCFCFCLYIWCM